MSEEREREKGEERERLRERMMVEEEEEVMKREPITRRAKMLKGGLRSAIQALLSVLVSSFDVLSLVSSTCTARWWV